MPDTFGVCDTTMWNFTSAALRVVPVSAGVAAVVLPAAAALAGASGVTPTLEVGGWFVYTYTVAYEGHTLELELRSKWDRGRSALFTIVDADTSVYEDWLGYDLLGTWVRMEIHDASSSLTGIAAWDLETLGGWCRFPNYKAGEMACWNETGCDVACPHY